MSSRHVATAMDLYMLSDPTSKYIEEQDHVYKVSQKY